MLNQILKPSFLLLLIPALFVFAIPQAFRLYFLRSDKKVRSGKITNRNDFFDFLKGIAITAVVMIHITQIYGDDPSHSASGTHYFHLNTFINGMLRFAIPVFLIASGVLITPFYSSFENFKSFYKARAIKLIPPFVLLCILIDHALPLHQLLYRMISGNTDVPYYFMIVLFQCYLLYPVLRLHKRYDFSLPAVLLISLFFEYNVSRDYIATIPLCGRLLFFFYYGIKNRNYFLNFDKIEPKKHEAYFWLSLIAFHAAFVFAFPERYYNSQYFFGLAVFHLAFIAKRKWNWTLKSWIARSFTFLGQKSLWIFLTHFQILLFFEKSVVSKNISFYERQPIVFALGFVTSIVAAAFADFIYQKISAPFLKKIPKIKPFKHRVSREYQTPASKAA